MTTTGRAPNTPPPCNQQCWTWVGTGDATGWIYTDTATACGHEPDGHGHWKWNRRPGPQTPQETSTP